MDKIIIGDVHGCYETLLKLIDKLPHKNLVFVGDLVDRGPDSDKVIKYVRDNNFDCVRGNHEQMMIDYHDGTEYFQGVWLLPQNGGLSTLKSYDGKMDQFKDDVMWLKTLPTVLEYNDILNDKGESLLVSHSMAYAPYLYPKHYAGPKKDHIIMWSRDFENIKPIPNRYNVFGHTPQENAKIKSFYSCIDTGVVYNKLTALEYPSMKTWEQET